MDERESHFGEIVNNHKDALTPLRTFLRADTDAIKRLHDTSSNTMTLGKTLYDFAKRHGSENNSSGRFTVEEELPDSQSVSLEMTRSDVFITRWRRTFERKTPTNLYTIIFKWDRPLGPDINPMSDTVNTVALSTSGDHQAIYEPTKAPYSAHVQQGFDKLLKRGVRDILVIAHTLAVKG